MLYLINHRQVNSLFKISRLRCLGRFSFTMIHGMVEIPLLLYFKRLNTILKLKQTQEKLKNVIAFVF